MIPTYQDILRPLLEVLNKNNILTLGKSTDLMSEVFSLTPANVKIARINGNRLAHLMIEHNVGVSIKTTYEIKKLDLDFFEE